MSTELTPRDGVVYEFAAGSALDGLVDTLIELGRASRADTVSAHRERDGDRLACYVWSGDDGRLRDAPRRLQPFALGTIEMIRLQGVKRLAGASWGEPPACHYVVRTDAAPGWDEELQRWYDQEHLAALAAVPGNVHAQRLLCLDQSPKFYACYDLVGADVLGSPAWLTVRNTAWSSRVRPHFTNTQRTLFADVLRCRIAPG
jgi:hypothetical protein